MTLAFRFAVLLALFKRTVWADSSARPSLRGLQGVPARSPVACSVEGRARTLLSTYMGQEMLSTGSRAPMFIRGVFHDAIDANNLLEKGPKGWSPWDQSAKYDGSSGWKYGGVDGCLYSTLASSAREAKHCEDGESENGMPCPGAQHNRNLKPAFDIAERVCKELGMGEDDDCIVDMMVLGAIVAVGDAEGPNMTMRWGRRKGDCQRLTCNDVSCKDATKAIDLAPSMFALDDLESFRTTWEKLGFSAKDETALMGAHTFGKLNVCVGGLNGVMRGHSCNKPESMLPPIDEGHLYPKCKPEAKLIEGKVVAQHNGCWKTGPRQSRGSCGRLPCTFAPELHPAFPIYGRYYESSKNKLVQARYEMLNTDNDEVYANVAVGEGFPDGGIWDQTPEVFDNNYFKLLQGETLDQKDICCGPTGTYKDRKYNAKGRVCLELGDEKKCLRKKTETECAKMHNRTTGKLAKSPDLCSTKWCRYGDKKGRSHMKSPTLWHEARHDFVKKADKYGSYKRLVRLAGDWALLSPETKTFVDTFATDQSEFFAAFEEAFEKVMNRGYDASELSACS